MPERAGDAVLCDAWIDWPDGERYECERPEPHDGREQMHAAVIDGEYTNWTDDAWLEAGRG